jgi:hypothetical protein
VRRLAALFSLALLALAFTAAPVLGHHVIGIDCDEEGVIVSANIGDGHKLVVTIDGTEVMNEAVDGAVIDQSFSFAWSTWPADVEVTILFPNGEKEDFEDGTVNCGTPEIDLDKFVWDEGGLVTQVTAGDPVTYTYEVTNDGNVNLDIALLEDLIVSSPEADPGDVACDDFARQADNPGNDDVIFEPGETWVLTCTVEGLPVGETDNEACVYANEIHELVADLVVDPRDSDVYSCAEYSISAVEGGTGGGQGTPPQGSIPDTAVSLSSPGAPLATFAFGMLLVSALGALAFVNVKSSRR